MKLFCDLLTRRRSNKKNLTIKLSSTPIQSFSNQTSNFFNKQSRCTCHYFNLNGNYLVENIPRESLSNHSNNMVYSSEMKYILSVEDFCVWYDVRSILFDIIDRVVAIDEVYHLNTEQILQSNRIEQKVRRSKTSIAIQTSSNNYEQRRNAKVQTNTVTLFH